MNKYTSFPIPVGLETEFYDLLLLGIPFVGAYGLNGGFNDSMSVNEVRLVEHITKILQDRGYKIDKQIQEKQS